MARTRFRNLFRLLLKLTLTLLCCLILALIAFRIASDVRESGIAGENLPASGKLIATEEGRIFVLSKGDPSDIAVLFAHGTAAWSGLWGPTLEALSERGFQASGFDMPPFGFSEHAFDRDYSRERQAQRVIALLEALPKKPIMVAHSVGAGPVVEAVMRRSDLVAGLIVVDGAIALGSHETPKQLPFFLANETLRGALVSATATNPLLTRILTRNFMYQKDAATPEIVGILQRPMGRANYTKAVADWIPQLFVPPIDALSTRPENWSSLKVPTAFIWGDKDDITPLEQGVELSGLMPMSKLIILPDVGHIPQIENPDKFMTALVEALNFVRQ